MRIARLVLVLLFGVSAFSQTSDKPNVRAITAFVRLTPAGMQDQLTDALKFLQAAKAAYEKHGYQVQTIRITTQPFTDYVKGMSQEEALVLLRRFDSWSEANSVDPNIGPAMMNDNDPADGVELMKQVLSTTKLLEGSIVVADTQGIHWKSARAAAEIIKYAADHSPHSQGPFNFTATAMLAPYAPFFPGSYHNGPGREFAIGLESANVVKRVFSTASMMSASEELAAELSKYAVECETIAKETAQATGWRYKGLDPTPAPQGKVSVGDAIESLTRSKFGSSGTMTAAAVITRAVKAVKVQQVGYSGLMVPILEDDRLAQRWSEGTINMDSLLAYSAVCGTGLDTVPLPGDVTVEQLTAIIGDMATLAFKWNKPLSARLQPIMGKKAGERTEFDNPFLVNAVIQPLP